MPEEKPQATSGALSVSGLSYELSWVGGVKLGGGQRDYEITWAESSSFLLYQMLVTSQ